MAAYGDKEPIYDEKIYPLMEQIIDICNKNGINFVASFQLHSEKEFDDGCLLCSTSNAINPEHFPDSFKTFAKALFTRSGPKMIAIAYTRSGDALN